MEGLLKNGPGYSSLLGKISDFRWKLLSNNSKSSKTPVFNLIPLRYPSSNETSPSFNQNNVSKISTTLFSDTWLSSYIGKSRTHNPCFLINMYHRSCLTEVVAYGQIPVPLVYTQVCGTSAQSGFKWKYNSCWFNQSWWLPTKGCNTCRLRLLCRFTHRRTMDREWEG